MVFKLFFFFSRVLFSNELLHRTLIFKIIFSKVRILRWSKIFTGWSKYEPWITPLEPWVPLAQPSHFTREETESQRGYNACSRSLSCKLDPTFSKAKFPAFMLCSHDSCLGLFYFIWEGGKDYFRAFYFSDLTPD